LEEIQTEMTRNGQTILAGKPEGKRPLGKPRPRWEDYIKINLWEIAVRIGLIWLRTETSAGIL
jgi:hypothetical protein